MRVYRLHNLGAGDERGFHAHKELQQVLVAVAGSVDVELDDGRNKVTYGLNNASKGLYLPAGLWRTLTINTNALSESTVMVLASLHYDEADYIRHYPDYLTYVGESPWGTALHPSV